MHFLWFNLQCVCVWGDTVSANHVYHDSHGIQSWRLIPLTRAALFCVNDRQCNSGHVTVKEQVWSKDIKLLAWGRTTVLILFAVYIPPLLTLMQPVMSSTQSQAHCRHSTHRPSHPQLRKMKAKKAMGPDRISSRLLKSCADQLCRIVEYIFNMNVKLGKVPLLWKSSCMEPVPKIPHSKSLLVRELQTSCSHFTPDEDSGAAGPRPSPPSGGSVYEPTPVRLSAWYWSGWRHHLPPGQITVSSGEAWKLCEDCGMLYQFTWGYLSLAGPLRQLTTCLGILSFGKYLSINNSYAAELPCCLTYITVSVITIAVDLFYISVFVYGCLCLYICFCKDVL